MIPRYTTTSDLYSSICTFSFVLKWPEKILFPVQINGTLLMKFVSCSSPLHSSPLPRQQRVPLPWLFHLRHHWGTKNTKNYHKLSTRSRSTVPKIQPPPPPKKKKSCMQNNKNNNHHMKVLLDSFHLNVHTLGFHPQIQKLEPPRTA